MLPNASRLSICRTETTQTVKIADEAEDRQRWSINRFVDATEEEMDEILTNIHSKNTTKSTNFAMQLLRDYCLSKLRDLELETLSKSTIKINDIRWN